MRLELTERAAGESQRASAWYVNVSSFAGGSATAATTAEEPARRRVERAERREPPPCVA